MLNKQIEIFEIKTLSNPLNFLHFYLIHFYTHGINSPKNVSVPRHISQLEKTFEKCKTASLFSRFCGTLF